MPKTNFLAEAKNHGRRRRSGGLGAVTSSRYVRDHAQLRATPSTAAQLPAPQPSLTHHTFSIARTHTLQCERTQLHSSLTRTREGPGLNPRCPKCLTVSNAH